MNRRRHLYSAGRPSRWELAHIVVNLALLYIRQKFVYASLCLKLHYWSILAPPEVGTLRVFSRDKYYHCRQCCSQTETLLPLLISPKLIAQQRTTITSRRHRHSVERIFSPRHNEIGTVSLPASSATNFSALHRNWFSRINFQFRINRLLHYL